MINVHTNKTRIQSKFRKYHSRKCPYSVTKLMSLPYRQMFFRFLLTVYFKIYVGGIVCYVCCSPVPGFFAKHSIVYWLALLCVSVVHYILLSIFHCRTISKYVYLFLPLMKFVCFPLLAVQIKWLQICLYKDFSRHISHFSCLNTQQ